MTVRIVALKSILSNQFCIKTFFSHFLQKKDIFHENKILGRWNLTSGWQLKLQHTEYSIQLPLYSINYSVNLILYPVLSIPWRALLRQPPPGIECAVTLTLERDWSDSPPPRDNYPLYCPLSGEVCSDMCAVSSVVSSVVWSEV